MVPRLPPPEGYGEDGLPLMKVSVTSYNALSDEIREMRTALEEIYDGHSQPQAIAARALRRGVWA